MPRTADEGFNDLLKNLKATAAESEAARNHRSSIERCLKRNFGLEAFFRAGSFGNGTSISGHSDVDYIARFPTKSLKKDSARTLSLVRDALAKTFPNTGVRVNSPAVKVPFGTRRSETTEVVPAGFVKAAGGHNVYGIADGGGGWMRTSPAAHNAYVRAIDGKMESKVKPLIRFVKAWKYYNDVPVSSFYLEMRTAKYAAGESSIYYWIDVYRVLNHLRYIGLARMRDPMDVAGYISPCSTQAKIEDSLSKLDTAATRAMKAFEAEKAGRTKEAFDWWGKLFDGKFPNYYK